MNDDELRRAYAAYRAAPAATDNAERPSLEEMQRLIAGELGDDDREALLDRVLSDRETTRELGMLQAVSQPSVEKRRWRPTPIWAMAAAAVLAVAIVPTLWRSRGAEQEPVFRSAEEQGTIRIVTPAEGVALAPGLKITWRSVPDADAYVVELVSERGDAVAKINSRDTTLVLPDSISAERMRMTRGMMVVARLRDGGQRQSLLRLLPKANLP